MNLCDGREGQANTKVYFGIIEYSKWRHVTHHSKGLAELSTMTHQFLRST